VAIADASSALVARWCDANVLDAFGAAREAFAALARASTLPLIPEAVRRAQRALDPLGAIVKTTGAGGGDVAIAALPRELADEARTTLRAIGCPPLALALDPNGAHLDG
jgi:mevalonate kinase